MLQIHQRTHVHVATCTRD